MPVRFLGEFGLDVMVDQIRNWNALLSLASAIFVNAHSQPVHGRLGQVFCRVLFDGSDDSGSAHSLSCSIVFESEKLPAVWSGLPLYAPETASLISQTHWYLPLN